MLRTSEIINRYFLLISAGILTATSIYKLIYVLSAGQPDRRLDPLVPVANYLMMLGSAGLEMIVVGVILFAKRNSLGNLAILWLALCFLTYRMGVWMLYPDPNYQCPCLGGITKIFLVDNRLVQDLLKILLGFFLLGSSFFLISEGKGNGKNIS